MREPPLANSVQITAATPGEFVAMRALSLYVPGSESVSALSHDSAPCAADGSARKARSASTRNLGTARPYPTPNGAWARISEWAILGSNQ